MATSKRLEGKVAIVTGAGSGIGRGSAVVLARAGARLVVNDINPDSGVETAKLIRDAGGESTFIQADVGCSESVRSLVAQTEDVYGRLDIVFANAGITNYVDLEEMTENDLERMLDTNFKGFLYCAKHSIPAMKRASCR